MSRPPGWASIQAITDEALRAQSHRDFHQYTFTTCVGSGCPTPTPETQKEHAVKDIDQTINDTMIVIDRLNDVAIALRGLVVAVRDARRREVEA